MKAVILDAAGEIVDHDFDGDLAEIISRVPEGGSYSLREEAPPPGDHSAEVNPIDPVIVKIAVFNAKGYPVNVLWGNPSVVGPLIQGLPPGSEAVTISGTPYEAVMMAGDLPTFDELTANIAASKE